MTTCPVCSGQGQLDVIDRGDPPRTLKLVCWRCGGERFVDDDDGSGPGDSLVPAPKKPDTGQAWAGLEIAPPRDPKGGD